MTVRRALKGLAIGSVDLVDAGDDPRALVRFFKRADGAVGFAGAGAIRKVDGDRREVFGWAYVAADEAGNAAVDKSGDTVTIEELEAAVYKYVQVSRVAGAMHTTPGVGTLIESFVNTPDKMAKLEIPPGMIPLGWWVGFKVQDADVWAKIRSGDYPAFSIAGTAKSRTAVNLPEGGRMATKSDVYKVVNQKAEEKMAADPELKLKPASARVEVLYENPDLRLAYEQAAADRETAVIAAAAAGRDLSEKTAVTKGADTLKKHAAKVEELKKADPRLSVAEARRLAWTPDLRDEYNAAFGAA